MIRSEFKLFQLLRLETETPWLAAILDKLSPAFTVYTVALPVCPEPPDEPELPDDPELPELPELPESDPLELPLIFSF
ncbi:hypothetical protein GCM10028868_31800 [Virgibacillus kimchii]